MCEQGTQESFAEYKVYPNPASALLVVKSCSAGKFNAVLTSAEGKVLASKSGRETLEFQLEDLPPGMYFLRVNGNTANKTFKILHHQ